MKFLFPKLLNRAADLVDLQPVVALLLGGALLAVFLTTILKPRKVTEPNTNGSLVWLLYHQVTRLLWAITLVGFLVAALSLMRVYLHQTFAGFQRNHGRITQANYNSVQTIWGAEQEQGGLRAELYYEDEVTERFESEDLTKPAVLRKKTVRHVIPGNPFISERHRVTLKQNARKKGSALYGGYETDCRFEWQLKNPAERDLNSSIRFPLPAESAMYDNLSAVLNGKDILSQMQLKEGALVLSRDFKAGEAVNLVIAFKSRGMSFWYLQVKEAREIRDFTLTLTLPDLGKSRLNYPEGCMTPTSVEVGPGNEGSLLTYRLDHAISSKGMGISLPTLPQPGATTNAVLAEIERGWLLIFAMLVLGLTLSAAPQAVLLSIFFGAAAACGYGLLADFSDLLFGFWGTAILVLLPLFLFLAWLLTRVAPRPAAKLLAFQFLLFGIIYPCAAGLDADHQTLYFNLFALIFLAFAASQLARQLGASGTPPIPQATPASAPTSPAAFSAPAA